MKSIADYLSLNYVVATKCLFDKTLVQESKKANRPMG